MASKTNAFRLHIEPAFKAVNQCFYFMNFHLLLDFFFPCPTRPTTQIPVLSSSCACDPCSPFPTRCFISSLLSPRSFKIGTCCSPPVTRVRQDRHPHACHETLRPPLRTISNLHRFHPCRVALGTISSTSCLLISSCLILPLVSGSSSAAADPHSILFQPIIPDSIPFHLVSSSLQPQPDALFQCPSLQAVSPHSFIFRLLLMCL